MTALGDRLCRNCGATRAECSCPRSQPCPTCGAKRGGPCKRPSGHAVFGGGFHARRRELAGETAEPKPHVCRPCQLGDHVDCQQGVWRRADGSDPVVCVCECRPRGAVGPATVEGGQVRLF